MGHAADRQVSGYSGGMRRRIDIAVSLVILPRCSFSTSRPPASTPRSRRDVWNLVASMKAQDITVLLTTQYLEEADILSDSIVILNAGQIVASGTSDELKRQTGSSYCEMTPAQSRRPVADRHGTRRLRRGRGRHRCDHGGGPGAQGCGHADRGVPADGRDRRRAHRHLPAPALPRRGVPAPHLPGHLEVTPFALLTARILGKSRMDLVFAVLVPMSG